MLGRLALVTVLLALPGALAQGGVGEPITLQVDEHREPILPVSGLASIPWRLDVACPAVGEGGARGAEVTLKAVDTPTWATVTVSPATVVVPDASACGASGRRQEKGNVHVATTHDAPAFVPQPIVVQATFRDATGEHAATAETSVRAAFKGILDVSVTEPIRVAVGGVPVSFDVVLTNFGNGDAKATIALQEEKPGWGVQVPEPILLGSKPDGDATSATVRVVITSPAGGVTQNEPGAFTFRVDTEYAGPAADRATGDSTTFSLLVTAKSAISQRAAGAPAALGALALAGAALVRALQAPRRR